MSTERFSHFLDALQSWSAEVPPSAAPLVTSSTASNLNQSARVKRVKGLLHAVAQGERNSDDDFEPAEDLLLGPDSIAGDADEHEL